MLRHKGGFPVMAETTRNHIFSKEISQVIIAAMVLAPISIEKIVCEWFQLWEEIRLKCAKFRSILISDKWAKAIWIVT